MSLLAEVDAARKTESLACEVSVVDLSREVGAAVAAVERKSTVPILGNVLLVGDGDRLQIFASDLELYYSSDIAAKDARGSISIPAVKLASYLRLAPAGPAKLSVGTNDAMTISVGKSRTRIAGLSADQFPELPNAEGDSITMAGSDLAALIRRVAFAISKEESRFTLNGARIELSADGELKAVSTDSHRLCWARVMVAGGFTAHRLVPAKALAVIAKMFESAEKVELIFAEKALAVRSGSRVVYARELTGNFPDYERVLPKDAGNKIECSTAELSGAIERVRTTADERSSRISLSAGGELLALSSELAGVGDSSETIDAAISGNDLSTGMNATYLLQFLSVVGSGRVEIRYKDGNAALDLRPAGGADYRYIVMPMRA